MHVHISPSNPLHGCPPCINPPRFTLSKSLMATISPSIVVKSFAAPGREALSNHCLRADGFIYKQFELDLVEPLAFDILFDLIVMLGT